MENTSMHGAKERLAAIVEDIDSLPSLPSIVLKLIDLVNSPDSSAEDAAELVEKDPALTSKMIRLANSAFYGIPRSISSVTSAVVVLGFNTVRSLALSASVAKMFESKQHSLDVDRFWRHSVATAMSARIIVRHFMSVRVMDPESAFCAGVLHDIGMLIFSQHLPDEYAAVCKHARENKIPLLDAEEEMLGMNHAQMGKILAERWSLPLDLEYAIVHHHTPENADKVVNLVNIVHMSDIIAQELGCTLWDDEVHRDESPSCRTALSMGGADYEKILMSIKGSLEKSQEFLAILK